MIVLAVSALEVLQVIGLGAVGFLVVILVCAGILGMLQMVLPKVDSGAEAAAATTPSTSPDGADPDISSHDTEANA